MSPDREPTNPRFPPPPPPTLLLPSSGPSTAQVISAAVQNVAAIVGLTIGFMAGKLGVELYLIAMGLVVGVDFLGRKKLPGALGAVGVIMNNHLLVLFFGASLVLPNCAGV